MEADYVTTPPAAQGEQADFFENFGEHDTPP